MAKVARRTEREWFWRQVLKKSDASGLGVRAFCRREGLSEPSFYAWRRELRLRDAESKQPAGAKQPTGRLTKQCCDTVLRRFSDM